MPRRFSLKAQDDKIRVLAEVEVLVDLIPYNKLLKVELRKLTDEFTIFAPKPFRFIIPFLNIRESPDIYIPVELLILAL